MPAHLSSSSSHKFSSSRQVLSTRDDASPNGGSSKMTTTIIIAVVVTLAGVVVLFGLFRLIRRCISRRNSAPLPPVQPIAHQREMDLAEFEESKLNPPAILDRRQSWRASGQTYLMAPPFPDNGTSSGTSSDLSLAQKFDAYNGYDSSTPQRVDSDASLHQRALGLEAPVPAFHGNGHSPVGSDSEHGSGSSSPMHLAFPTPISPDTPISASSNNSQTHLYSTARHRNRPSSVASNYSRTSRKSSASKIQGAPHGPHSSVNIVLPTPLAPTLSPYGHVTDDGARWDTHTSRSRASSRVSVVDQWAGVPINRSERDVEREKEKEKKEKKQEKKANWTAYALAHPDQPRPSTGSGHTYSSSSSTNPNAQQPVATKVTRAPSNPSSSPRNSRQLDNRASGPPPSAFRDLSSSPPPAVPRIPSIYGNLGDSEMGRPKSTGGLEPFAFERANSVNMQNSLNRTSVPQVHRQYSLTRPGSGYMSDDGPVSLSRSNSRTGSGYVSDSATGSPRTTQKTTGQGPRVVSSPRRMGSTSGYASDPANGPPSRSNSYTRTASGRVVPVSRSTGASGVVRQHGSASSQSRN